MSDDPINDGKFKETPARASAASHLEAIQQGISNLDSDNTDNESRKILHERAIALARSSQQESAVVEYLEVVEFILSKERYAFETAYLKEIHPFKAIALLPGAPSFVNGLVNVRGQIVVVVNLKEFFDLKDVKQDDRNQILIVECKGRQVGFLADAVHHIRKVSLDDLQGPLPTLTGVKSEFVRGITNDRTIILDADRIILSDKILINDNDVSQNLLSTK